MLIFILHVDLVENSVQIVVSYILFSKKKLLKLVMLQQ